MNRDDILKYVEYYRNNVCNNLNKIGSYTKKNYKDIYDYVLDKTSFAKNTSKIRYSFEHRLFFVLNNLTSFPLCEICHKENVRGSIDINGYVGIKKYCYKCYRKSEEYKKSIFDKYECYNVSCSKLIQEKKKRTCFEHYGVLNPSQNKLIQSKKIQTNLLKYGCVDYNQTQECKDRIKNICLERYGTDNASQNLDIKKKKIATSMKNFGCEYWSQLEDNRKYLSIVNKNNSRERMLKIRETCLLKYNASHFMKSKIYKDKFHKMRCEKCYSKILESEYVEPLFDLNYFIEHNDDILRWKCKKCGCEFETKKLKSTNTYFYHFARCEKCYPIKSINKSSYEFEIFDFIKEIYGGDVICNDKKTISPLELDINIKDKNIAIECNGLYWHSELYKDEMYHYVKLEKCVDKSINLISIFEDDWLYKKSIVKSRIKNLLGVYDKTIYARRCEIKTIGFDLCSEFLNNNHIQGSCSSSVNYGLFYDSELVSVMTFGSYRRCLGRKSKENEYELLRFCNKCGYHIPGAASKLLKHFILDHNPIKIISYADRCWSNGNLYDKLGFNLIGITKPNYYYIVNNKRQHRFNWRKNVLKDKLKVFDPNKTEHENMLDNNLYRIYDCGSFVYQLDCIN